VGKRRGKPIIVWLPEDHPIWLIPAGKRSAFIRSRLDPPLEAGTSSSLSSFIPLIETAVRNVVREELASLDLSGGYMNHCSSTPVENNTINLKAFKENLSIYEG